VDQRRVADDRFNLLGHALEDGGFLGADLASVFHGDLRRGD
jgi:hypothetical protein